MVYPLLILGIAGWLLLDQRKTESADQQVVERALIGFVDAYSRGEDPALPLSDPSMRDVLVRELSALAGTTYAVSVTAADAAGRHRYEARFVATERATEQCVVIVEKMADRIMIVGYRLPHAPAEHSDEAETS